MHKDRQITGRKNVFRIIKWIVLTSLLALVLIFAGERWFFKRDIGDWSNLISQFISLDDNVQTDSDIKDQIDMDLFWRVLALLEDNYLNTSELDAEQLLYGAIAGMVDATGDPYTAFYTPDQNSDFNQGLKGIYEGIGAQLGFKDDQLVVVAPLEGSPAEVAGVEAGDAILAVDNEITAGWSLNKAVDKIRGEAESEVSLTLRAVGTEESRQVVVVREEIKIPAVRLTWPQSQIAHIKVLRFGPDTNKEWDRSVSAALDADVAGIILDLRNNPGGYLDSAIHITSDFFTDGVVVKKQTNQSIDEFGVAHKCRLCNIPVYVLVNGGSASASEILAGSLQSRGRASLVGELTFGKGTVQEALELEKGASVHITTARWLLPNDQSIQEKGLTPDYPVAANQQFGPFSDVEGDAQFQEALRLLLETVNG